MKKDTLFTQQYNKKRGFINELGKYNHDNFLYIINSCTCNTYNTCSKDDD